MEKQSSNSICVLCYKVASDLDTNQDRNCSKKFIELISRFLNIQPKFGESKFVTCDDCFEWGESFRVLYFQCEYLRLQMEWRVKELFDIIKCNLNNVSTKNETCRKEKENDSDGEGGIQKLREELLKGCENRLNSSFPKVVVQKTKKVLPPDSDNLKLVKGLMNHLAVYDLSLPFLQNQENFETENEQMKKTIFFSVDKILQICTSNGVRQKESESKKGNPVIPPVTQNEKKRISKPCPLSKKTDHRQQLNKIVGACSDNQEMENETENGKDIVLLVKPNKKKRQPPRKDIDLEKNSGVKFSYPKCSKTFENEICLDCHMQVQHSSLVDSNTEQQMVEESSSVNNSTETVLVTVPAPTTPSLSNCHICDSTFDSSVLLTLHLRSVHQTNDLFECPVCRRKSKTAHKFRAHMRLAHNTTSCLPGSFQCDKCQERFTNVAGLKIHLARVHKIYSQNLSVRRKRRLQAIKKRAVSSLALISSGNTSFLSMKNLNCPVCKASSRSHKELGTHLRLRHCRILAFECRHCKAELNSLEGFRSHMYFIHGTIFSTNQKLVNPENLSFGSIEIQDANGEQDNMASPAAVDDSQTGFPPFSTIEEELEPTPGPSTLVAQEETRKVFKCEWKGCNKIFSQKRYMKNHLRRHTNKKQFLKVGCSSKNFKTKLERGSHQNSTVHSTHGQPSSSVNLKAYEKSLLKKRFHLKCEKCPKLFESKGKQQSYMYYMHGQSKRRPTIRKRSATSSIPPEEIPACYPGRQEVKENDVNPPKTFWPSVGVDESSTFPISVEQLEPMMPGPSALISQQQTLKNFKCDWKGCGKRCTTKEKLIIHKRMHTGETPYPCSWPGCTLTFTSEWERDKHQKNSARQEPSSSSSALSKSQWKACEKPQSKPNKLSLHLKKKRFRFADENPSESKIQENSPYFTCGFCKTRFAERLQVISHVEIVHNKKFICECTSCGENDMSLKSFEIHMKLRHQKVYESEEQLMLGNHVRCSYVEVKCSEENQEQIMQLSPSKILVIPLD